MHDSTKPPPLRSLLRQFPPAVWFLFLGTFLNKFGSFVMPFIALYMHDKGLSYQSAGLVIGAYGAGNLVAAAVGGYLADRIGRRKTITFSMVLAAISMSLLSQASGFTSLFVLTFIAGAASEFYRPAASALLIDLVPEQNRATAFAAYRVALNAGWAAGPATAGFVAHYSFFLLFVGDALTSLAFGIVAWCALPKGLPTHSACQQSFRKSLSVIRRDRALRWYLLAVLGPAILFFQIHTTFSAYVTQSGYSTETYGLLLSLNGLLIIVFEFPITYFTQQFHPRRVIALGYALIGLGVAMNGLSTALGALVCAMIVFTLGEMISMPITSTFLSHLAPAHMRGRYMGANGVAWSLAMSLSPALGMWSFQAAPDAFWVSSLVIGIAAGSVMLYEPAKEPD